LNFQSKEPTMPLEEIYIAGMIYPGMDLKVVEGISYQEGEKTKKEDADLPLSF